MELRERLPTWAKLLKTVIQSTWVQGPTLQLIFPEGINLTFQTENGAVNLISTCTRVKIPT